MKEKNTFLIGELSKLFGVGVDSIRYYEEVGILQPKRDPNNNYRLYTVEDVRKIVLIRELLNLNFSTEQIKEFTMNRSVDKTIQLLEKELQIVNEQILSLYETKTNLQNRLDTMRNLLNNYEEEVIQVLDLEERACIMVTDDNLPDIYVDYYVIKYMHRHRNHIETIGACDCYTLDLPGSNPESLYYRTKNVFFYAPYLPEHECNYKLPAGKYLSITYRGPLRKTKELLPKLLEYAEQEHYTILREPIEFCHIDDYETNNEEEYLIEIQLPVEKG
ncbi:MAG: MerR family transcriptional regulator [Wujia sp.]